MKSSIAQRSLLLASMMAALLVLSAPPAAQAHEGAGRLALAHVPVGPYRLTTQVSPETVRVGEVRIGASVVDEHGRATDCDVFIRVTPIGHGGPSLSAKTSHADHSHQRTREARLRLPEEGKYQVRVAVRDQFGRGGQAAFEIDVHPSSLLVLVLVYCQLLSAPVIGLWLSQRALRAWFPRHLKIRTR